jgi:hypothetical protein
MRNLFLTLIITLSALSSLHAQKVRIKGSSVFIDTTECLKLLAEPTHITYYNLSGEALFILKFAKHYGKPYTEVIFLNEGISFTSVSYTFTKKLLVKKMTEHGVINDCKLDAKKAEVFALTFQEPLW